MRGFTRRRRRRIAITTAVLWLLAVEVLPNLHLAFHNDDHTHRHDGTIVHREAEPQNDHHADVDHHHHHHADVDHHHHHHHADVEHHHHGHDTPLRHDGELVLDEVPVAHAAAGIAHHALALLDPAPPIVDPIGVPLSEPWRHAAPTTVFRSAALARPNARGPPAV